MSNGTTEHTVKPGETLFGIAKQNNVSSEAILAANPEITNPGLIQVGQVIRIPTSAPAGSTDSPPADVSETSGQPSTSTGAAGANAILDRFQPAGASAKTAKQDTLPAGVNSSEKMAQFDRKRVMAHKEKFVLAASKFGLPPALLAGIASRESRGGNQLDKKGFGDHGHGFGIMQVDDGTVVAATQDGPAGQAHINQATGILASKLKIVRQKFPDLGEVEQLQMAVSRYNGGAAKQPPNSDQGTTGGDYMNDVWARARFYARVEDWG